MKGLSELILSLFDLAEAEGRVLKVNAIGATRSCALTLLGFLFGAAGLVFFLAAAYDLLIKILPRWLVLCAVGAGCLVLAAIILWSARGWKKKKRMKEPIRKKN